MRQLGHYTLTTCIILSVSAYISKVTLANGSPCIRDLHCTLFSKDFSLKNSNLFMKLRLLLFFELWFLLVKF